MTIVLKTSSCENAARVRHKTHLVEEAEPMSIALRPRRHCEPAGHVCRQMHLRRASVQLMCVSPVLDGDGAKTAGFRGRH